MNEPVTFETDFWVLSLPPGWQHQPIENFAVSSEDDTKKIIVKVYAPKSGDFYDRASVLDSFEQAIRTSSGKSLNLNHKRFVTEQKSLPPYTTLLLASFDNAANFGIAAMTWVTSDHSIYISIHDYWSEDQAAFEKFFRSILEGFNPIASSAS